MKNVYAKVLVGKHAGKTFYVTSTLDDNTILIRIDRMYWEYQEDEYELVNIYNYNK